MNSTIPSHVQIVSSSLIAPGLPDFYLTLLPEKFPEISKDEWVSSLNELLKFFHLSSAMQGPFFYPISGFLDDIIHLFILQTKVYPNFCARFRAGWQLEHQSQLANEKRKLEDILENHLSWMASYVGNLGPFTLEALPHWPGAFFIFKQLNCSLSTFNEWCGNLPQLWPAR